MLFKQCVKIFSLITVSFILTYYGRGQFGHSTRSEVTEIKQDQVHDEVHHSHGTVVNNHVEPRTAFITTAGEDPGKIISEECRAVLHGDMERIEEFRNSSKDFPWRDLTSDTDVIQTASYCVHLYRRYNFHQLLDSNFRISKEELEFPIAYSILAHKNVNQILLLLSAIYRKHNIHCIHLDAKASKETKEALSKVTECFPNVFIARKLENVIYAHVSRLLADLACMTDLLIIPRTKYNWKYLINLCSQDFPLRTNTEIVEQLKEFQGFNSIGGYSKLSDIIRKRTEFVYRIENVTKNGMTEKKVVMTSQAHSPPPFNMAIVKNLAYNLYARDFLQWALVESQVGTVLLNWSMDTYSPDEHYSLMLHMYPGAPGGSQLTSGFQLARLIKWQFGDDIRHSCHGEWRHYICVLGAEDIHGLTARRELFVNKLDVTLDSTGPTCLRQMLDERILIPNYLRSKTNPDRNAVSPPENFYL